MAICQPTFLVSKKLVDGTHESNRIEVFSPDEVAMVHVINGVVRRWCLVGDDPVTEKYYDHRRVQIEGLIERFAGLFAIDLLTYSILSE
jgi:hypothetical protein